MKTMKNNNADIIDVSTNPEFENTWVRDHKFWSSGILESFNSYCVGGKIEAFNLEWFTDSARAYKLLWSEIVYLQPELKGPLMLETHFHVQHYIHSSDRQDPFKSSHLKFGTNKEAATSHFESIDLKV